MSEPMLTIDHQATLQPSPIAAPPTDVPQSAGSAQTTPIDQYQPPASNGSSAASNPPPTSSSVPPVDPANAFPGVPKPVAEEVVLEWTAPSRPHKQRQKKYFTTIAIFVLLIGAILFFLNQLILIGVVIAVAFLVYVLEMVPPGMVDFQLTTFGIRVEKTLYYWEELGFFWFTQRYGQKIMHVEVARFPGRLTLLLGNVPEEEIKFLMSQVLVNQQPPPTTFEKAASWLEKLIPLEHEQPVT